MLNVVPTPRDSSRRESLIAAALKRLSERALDLSGDFKSMVRSGDPADEINAAARVTQSRMIVMASHGRSGLTRAVRGSVAERVLRTTDVPLLLCNPSELQSGKEAPFLRILVPLDGSEHAAAILPIVEELALTHGSEVVLLCVESQALEEGTQRHGQVTAFLNHYARHLAGRGITNVTLRSAKGAPAAQILAGIEETRGDLVAMTTHGRTGFSRLRFGSVAEEVMRSCVRPLLVVRNASPE